MSARVHPAPVVHTAIASLVVTFALVPGLGSGSVATAAPPADDTPIVAPDEPIVAPDEPIVAPDEPIVAPDEPIVAPDAAAHPAPAKAKKRRKAPYTLHDVVVTGTRTKRKLADVPVKTEVVDAKRIKAKGATNLIEALTFEPGIRIDNQCSICNTSQIKLGGMPGRYTLLLIDGVPIYSSLGQTYGLLNIAASNIERIEIVKGAGSLLYGTDALGGVVNVLTRRPSGRPEAKLQLEIGDFGHREVVGSASMYTGDLGLSLVASATTHDKVDRDGDGVSEYTGYDRIYAAGRAFWDPTNDLSVDLRTSWAQENRQGGGLGPLLAVVTDDAGRRGLSETILTRRFEASLKADWEATRDALLTTTMALTLHDQDSDYEGELYQGDQTVLFVQEAAQLQLLANYSLVAGLSYRLEKLGESVAKSDYTYHMPGVMVEGDWYPTAWLEILHGLRYDWHNKFGNVLTWRFAAKAKAFDDHLVMRLGAGTGFRAPTTFYEYAHGVRPDGYALVNETDSAERSTSLTFDATLDYGSALKATASASYHRVANPISVESVEAVSGGGADRVRVFNVHEPLAVAGAELVLRSRPLPWLSTSLGYGFFSYDDPGHAMVSAAPRHQLTASLDFDLTEGGFKASVNAEVTAPMDLEAVYGPGYNGVDGIDLEGWLDPANADLNNPKLAESPWYGVLDVRVEQRLVKGVSLYLGVNNLLDYQQADIDSPLYFPAADDGSPDPADVIHIWGPLRGRFFYGGLELEI